MVRLGGAWHCGVAAVDFRAAVREARAAAAAHPASVLLLDNLDDAFPASDEGSDAFGLGDLGAAPDGAGLLLLCELLRWPPAGTFVVGIARTSTALLQVRAGGACAPPSPPLRCT